MKTKVINSTRSRFICWRNKTCSLECNVWLNALKATLPEFYKWKMRRNYNVVPISLKTERTEKRSHIMSSVANRKKSDSNTELEKPRVDFDTWSYPEESISTYNTFPQILVIMTNRVVTFPLEIFWLYYII